MIDQAEQWLRQHGLRILRVPLSQGRSSTHRSPARRPAPLRRAPAPGRVITAFRTLGFKFVTLDLEGFRSGSMNSVISVESLLGGVTARVTTPTAGAQS